MGDIFRVAVYAAIGQDFIVVDNQYRRPGGRRVTRIAQIRCGWMAGRLAQHADMTA